MKGSAHVVHALLALVCGAFLLTSSSQCQILNIGDDTTTPVEGAGHDYIKMLSETVNPANGSVSLRIQGPVANGRGITVPFSFNYDSNGVNHLTAGPYGPNTCCNLPWDEWMSNTTFLSQGGWSLGLPLISLNYFNLTCADGATESDTSNYTFQDPSGGRHSLYLAGNNDQCGNAQFTTGGDSQYYGWFTNGGGWDSPLTVSDVDGTTFHFSNPMRHDVGGYWSALPDYIEDRNGNQATVYDAGLNGGTVGAFTLTDSVGRSSISTNGFGPGGSTNTFTISDSSYQVSWETISGTFSVSSTQVNSENGVSCFSVPAASGNLVVVSSITLPNGEKYNFQYNSWGLLKEIDYPTGAWVNYSWKMSDQLAEIIVFDGYAYNSTTKTYNFYQNACQYHYSVPVVATRTVGIGGSSTSSGSTTTLTQTFSYATAWNSGNTTWNTKSTTVKTNDPVLSNNFQTINNYSYTEVGSMSPPYGNGWPSQIPVESSIQYYNWGNTSTPIHTVNKTWLDMFDLSSAQTVLNDENSLTSETTYSYQFAQKTALGSALSQLIQKNDYDYGLNLLRTAVTTYQGFTSGLGVIADKPCKVVTTDGNNNRMAEADYLYDNGTTLCGTAGSPSVTGVSNLTNHDETNYGPSSKLSRGNVTNKTQWLSTGSPVTSYTYDETGQVLSKTDPCGNANGGCTDMTGSTHTTKYSYSDSYTILSGGSNTAYKPSGSTNAYLTQITNALGQNSTFTYDYNNGQLTASADQNDISAGRAGTTYIYNDPFSRPTVVNYPDGGQTEYAYNDAVPSVTTCQNISGTASATCSATSPASGWKTSLSTMDGMEHVIETQLVSDPVATDTVNISYDGQGHALTRSNPHRSTSSTTDGTTAYSYDALGRTIQVTDADGSIATTAYDQSNSKSTGACVTSTDEAGASRQSCSDGLGRLTGVWENPSGLNYETDYTYDALNNLLTVTQKGGSTQSNTWRVRNFQYDSLSRLTSAANPESGSIGYSYDVNGNLSTKTALSPNQPSSGKATVATNYNYDVLNRLTGKNYTDTYNPSSTPVTYGYDGVNLSCPTPVGFAGTSGTNVIGRRSAICFNAGSKSWTFDAMGRIHGENDRFIGLVPPYGPDESNINGVPTLSSDTTYAYYLNGDSQNVFYPEPKDPEYEFYTSENAAGEVTSAGDVYYNVLTNATYTPTGQLATATIGEGGNYNGSQISNTYNNRLQPVLMSASTYSGTPILNLTYNFNAGNGTSGSGTDNGNVIQIANGKSSSRTQNFLYDPLNRIWQAYSSGTNWGETYSNTAYAAGTAFKASTAGIDAWGNLTNISPVTGKTSSESLVCASANTSNQLNTCFTYDAAGNLIKNGSETYFYDDENRLIATSGTSYVYDGDGNRVEKCTEAMNGNTPLPGQCASNATGIFYWLHAGGGTLGESDLGGNWTAAYGLIHGQIASRVDLPSATVHYYYHDHLNTTDIVTDALGNVLKESDYFPYGGEMIITNNDTNRYKFAGKERDGESGLDNFGARYNASNLGRFMTPDPSPNGVAPLDPQSWNLYSYTRNRPTNFIDTRGNWATGVHAQIVTYALQDYVSAGELQQLVAAQYVIDSYNDPGTDQAMHAMANGKINQSATDASTQTGQFVDLMMGEAKANLGPNGSETSLSLAFEGFGIHTVEDSTSPEHTSANGLPTSWYGIGHYFGLAALKHWAGENSPENDWSAIGQAIKLTMAFHLVLGAGCEQGKTCLTKQNFNAEVEKNITNYVNRYYGVGQTDIDGTIAIESDAARQCALGNPAACIE